MCLLSLHSHFKRSFVSIVFDFSASLNDVAPASPNSFADEVTRKEKSELLMDVFGVSFFVFTTQIEFCE